MLAVCAGIGLGLAVTDTQWSLDRQLIGHPALTCSVCPGLRYAMAS
jgi:hypothetical protein